MIVRRENQKIKMKGIWIIAIIVIAIIIVGAVIFTGSNNSETGGTGATGGNQESNTGASSAGAGSSGAGSSDNGDNAESSTTPTTHNIEISDFSFQPATLTIKQGDTVKWTNQDSASHTVTSDSGSELDSELLSNEQSYSHTFNEAGTFEYHCTPHPYMKAKIIVSE